MESEQTEMVTRAHIDSDKYRVAPDMLDRVKEAADDEGVSASDIVRQALAEWLGAGPSG